MVIYLPKKSKMSKKKLENYNYDELMTVMQQNLERIRESDVPLSELTELIGQSKKIYELATAKLKDLEKQINSIVDEEE